MTPSELIVASSTAAQVVMDDQGRKLALRRMTVLDRLRLFKAAGPQLAQNGPWLGIALLACSVTAIDDVPVPTPVTEQQIEALVAKLGDDGIAAAAGALASSVEATAETARQTAGN